jgi:hypothetical protein
MYRVSHFWVGVTKIGADENVTFLSLLVKKVANLIIATRREVNVSRANAYNE